MHIILPPRGEIGDPIFPSSAEAIYRLALSERTPLALAAPFTAHVLACALTIGLIEACENNADLSTTLGLGKGALEALTRQWTPGVHQLVDLTSQADIIIRDEEETQLHDLLSRFKSDTSPLCCWITAIVSRRAMAPRHLWQDLGLVERRELTQVMTDWFPTLAAANLDNMKWKKFLYRKLCESEGFALCAAPTCRECEDFDNCFGTEDGQSVLARLSRR